MFSIDMLAQVSYLNSIMKHLVNITNRVTNDGNTIIFIKPVRLYSNKRYIHNTNKCKQYNNRLVNVRIMNTVTNNNDDNIVTTIIESYNIRQYNTNKINNKQPPYTHFLALPIYSNELEYNYNNIFLTQHNLVDKRMYADTRSLHITLLMLSLQDKAVLEQAKVSLHKCKQHIYNIINNQQLLLSFTGVDTFQTNYDQCRVIFAKPCNINTMNIINNVLHVIIQQFISDDIINVQQLNTTRAYNTPIKLKQHNNNNANNSDCNDNVTDNNATMQDSTNDTALHNNVNDTSIDCSNIMRQDQETVNDTQHKQLVLERLSQLHHSNIDVKYHLTLLNSKYAARGKYNKVSYITFDGNEILNKFNNFNFGNVNINELQLCKRQRDMKTGKYIVETNIVFDNTSSTQ